MCVRSAGQPEPVPLANGNAVTDQLIALSDARKTDRITVAGHRTLDIFLGLFRRGFLNASCCASAGGPQTTDDRADSLWIVEPEDVAELRNLIAACGRNLRRDGTLLLATHHTAGGGADIIGMVLRRCGFMPIREITSTVGMLLLCQRQSIAGVAIAA